MNVVADTNVLVSGLLSTHGPPARIAELVAVGKIKLCYDQRILAEYREVLLRKRFAFDPILIDRFLEQIELAGRAVICEPWPVELADRDDEKFLETAVAASARCLITGNLRHFPIAKRLQVVIVSPREFIELLRKEGFKL